MIKTVEIFGGKIYILNLLQVSLIFDPDISSNLQTIFFLFDAPDVQNISSDYSRKWRIVYVLYSFIHNIFHFFILFFWDVSSGFECMPQENKISWAVQPIIGLQFHVAQCTILWSNQSFNNKLLNFWIYFFDQFRRTNNCS